MSGISSGVGLLSGLPTAEIIEQLMAIEARPIQLVQNRVGVIQSQRAAFADLSARLLSLKNAVARFDEPAFFKQFSANSSNPDVFTATAASNAATGSFAFQVHSLVSNHSLVSKGFADSDKTPIGVGTLTLEQGKGFLNDSTPLEALNGGEGVRRGRIEITDRAGRTAEIDLTTALTVDDILQAINSQTGISVRAEVSGDRLVLTDTSTAPTGDLIIRDLGSGHTAADLGIAQTSTEGRIESIDLVNLTNSSLLSTLNDSNGVGRARSGDDFVINRADGTSFSISLSGNIGDTTRLEMLNNGNGVRLGTIRITDKSGATADVDLSAATNLQEVFEAIEASGLNISTTYFNSSTKHALQLTDNSEGEGSFKIEDVNGFAARDLGIASEADTGSIVGNGIHRVETIGDIIRTIQYAVDNEGNYNEGRIVAQIDPNGNRLQLQSLGIPRDFTVEAIADVDGFPSTAADDLGILGNYPDGVFEGQSRDIIAGLNSVLLRSLNGGSGITAGTIRVTDRTGAFAEVDLVGAQTVQDVIDRINQAATAGGVQVSAAINQIGHGLTITDQSEGGGTLTIADVSGTAAADLKIATDAAGVTGEKVESGNLQLQYISARTRLSKLNAGRGVRQGTFRIADSTGAISNINITASQTTVGDVINLINTSTSGRVRASINATGDGILLTDTAGGELPLKVTDQDGFAGADLNILGETAEDETTIDGSYEVNIEIDADDTLQDIARKINESGGDFTAAVINDGSSTAPYRLSLNSAVSGLRGRLLFDGAGIGLDLNTLVEARDAVVFLGEAGAENPVILQSPTNSLNNVLQGVTIELTGTSDEPVDLNVTQDLDSIAEDIRSFVDSYNAVIERIDAQTSFNSETFARGILFGDSTVNLIENRLFRSATGRYEVSSATISRLSDIGISIAPSSGGKLEFDEAEFREIYAANPEAVENLFNATETGFGAVFEEMVDGLSNGFDSIIAEKDTTLQRQEELLKGRIDALNALLVQKRARLERQFQGLESALAALQAQQTSLATLASLASGNG